MNDRDFVDAFESCTLPPAQFHHREHIRLAWLYLREAPLLAALPRFVASLRRYATHLGQPQLYHETITWMYLLLIHERMQRGDSETFDAFCDANGDLLTWQPSILDRYYDAATLQSDLARRVFVLPAPASM